MLFFGSKVTVHLSLTADSGTRLLDSIAHLKGVHLAEIWVTAPCYVPLSNPSELSPPRGDTSGQLSEDATRILR